jgi:hypothetical protein
MRMPQPVVGIATTIKNKGYLVHISAGRSRRLEINYPYAWFRLVTTHVMLDEIVRAHGYFGEVGFRRIFSPVSARLNIPHSPVNRGFVKLSPSLRTDPGRASKEITPAAASCGSARILENQIKVCPSQMFSIMSAS